MAFLFPGHGVLRHPTGAAPYRLLPAFREHFDEIAGFARARFGIDLSPVVSGTPVAPEWFEDWAHQQLGLYTLGYALARQLQEWG